MKFVPLYFDNKIRVVNPEAHIGLLTLWSYPEYAIGKLEEAGVDFNPATSKIAAVGTLYGNGLPQLLRNLLYNPQITDLIFYGLQRDESQCGGRDLIAFLEYGLEETELLGKTVWRIKGRKRLIDNLVKPEDFASRIRTYYFPDISKGFAGHVKQLIDELEPIEHSQARAYIPLPEYKINSYPSNIFAHQVVGNNPLETWRQLVGRVYRFGQHVELAKGTRQELVGVKAVVNNPYGDDPKALADFGQDLEELTSYQDIIMDPTLQDGQKYTYGNRLRDYFGFDFLEVATSKLAEDCQARDVYFALWDNRTDYQKSSPPCFTNLFFRFADGKLNLLAEFRSHNLLDGWLKNVYGLAAILKYVCEGANLEPGKIVIIRY